MKLFPRESVRPLPLGTPVKAFHPMTLGVVHGGVIVGASQSDQGAGPTTMRYRIRFDVTAKRQRLFWVRANDIVAMQGDDGVWTRRDPA